MHTTGTPRIASYWNVHPPASPRQPANPARPLANRARASTKRHVRRSRPNPYRLTGNPPIVPRKARGEPGRVFRGSARQTSSGSSIPIPASPLATSIPVCLPFANSLENQRPALPTKHHGRIPPARLPAPIPRPSRPGTRTGSFTEGIPNPGRSGSIRRVTTNQLFSRNH